MTWDGYAIATRGLPRWPGRSYLEGPGCVRNAHPAGSVDLFRRTIARIAKSRLVRRLLMLDTEAFREFKQGLALLRDDYALKALPHMRRAAELDKNNPYYMSYLGVVLARSEEKWGEAEKLCDAAVRMKRNQAQLYLNLAEVYSAAGRPDEALEVLEAGLKYARRDIRLTIAKNKLTPRRVPVLGFLSRQHPVNRQLGRLRHQAMLAFGQR
jgi:tetratricopeptide (TPR) repeat protein